MANSNGIISAPIGIQPDIYGVLGLTKTGTFYDIGHVNGNAHGKINPWAKYKPERINQPGDITLEQRRNNNFGLTPFNVAALSGLPVAYEQHPEEMHGWTYTAPDPDKDYTRFTDFDGYNHNAHPPYERLYGPDTVGLNQQDFSFTCMMSAATGDDMVKFTDMQNLGDLYFGIYITGERTVFATNDIPGSGNVEFTTPGFVAGSYTGYPFLSTAKQTQGGTLQAGRFYTVPCIEPVQFTMVNTTLSVTIRARKGTSGVIAISYTVTVHNNSGTTTLRNNRLFLRYSNKDLYDTMVAGEQYVDIPDVTCPNGVTEVASGTFTGIPADLYASPRLWVTMHNGQYVGSAVPLTPAPGVDE